MKQRPAETPNDSALREVNMSVNESGQKKPAPQICDGRRGMGMAKRSVVSACFYPAAADQQATVGKVFESLFGPERVARSVEDRRSQ